RSRLLREATRLFAAKGFDGTSLKDIAEAVGIRKPSLLYHFRSKDELRRSVLDQMLAHWNEVLPSLLRAATSGVGQFDAVVEETVGFFVEDPDRARLLVREALDRPVQTSRLIADYVRPWAVIVCNYIRKGQQQGRVYSDVDPESYVAQVINLMISSIATFQCLGDVAPPGLTQKQRATRHIRELCRVAKSSLFLPTADAT
ncbi:MAG: TetR/AcrR family transcriptional regulator, partial [Nannocystaceae bacterium]